MAEAAEAVTVKTTVDHIQVYIQGGLHLHVNRRKFLGVQAWQYTHNRQYFIEFTLELGTITTEYNDKALWLAVLKAVTEVL